MNINKIIQSFHNVTASTSRTYLRHVECCNLSTTLSSYTQSGRAFSFSLVWLDLESGGSRSGRVGSGHENGTLMAVTQSCAYMYVTNAALYDFNEIVPACNFDENEDSHKSIPLHITARSVAVTPANAAKKRSIYASLGRPSPSSFPSTWTLSYYISNGGSVYCTF